MHQNSYIDSINYTHIKLKIYKNSDRFLICIKLKIKIE